jgi:nitroreductase
MQNETLNVLRSRRSIRKYKPQPISEEELQAILQAAIYSPSGMNLQGWHFTAVRSPEMMAKLKGLMKEAMLNSGDPRRVERASEPGFVALHDAPGMIFLSAPADSRYARLDCGIAVENIALAAESLGIGSCILASSELLFDADKDGSLAKELGFPAGYKHVCSITLGYKDESPEAKPRIEGLINYV